MTDFHATVTGKQDGHHIRVERILEGRQPRTVATQALWYAQIAMIEPLLVIVKDMEGTAFKRTHVYKPDELRSLFFADHARPSVTINAQHLPPEERNRVTAAIHGGDLPGIVSEGQVALPASQIDPLAIEDAMPTLSTLLQIAGDEGMQWLFLHVHGDYLDALETFSEE